MPEALSTLLPLLAILAVFWLIVIRPASRRNRDLAQLHAQLEPGDRVMLSSGIYGTLRERLDDRVTVELAPGVVIEVATGAIAGRDAGAHDGAEDDGPDYEPDDDNAPESDAPEER